MNTREIETIRYRDMAREDDACIVVRIVERNVALCISLKSDGDIESIFSKAVAARLIEALKKAET